MDLLLLVVTRSMAQGDRPMGGMDLVQAHIFAPQEVILILLMALLFCGDKKRPEISRSLGKAMRELQRTTDAWDQPMPSERPQAVPGGSAPRAPDTPV